MKVLPYSESCFAFYSKHPESIFGLDPSCVPTVENSSSWFIVGKESFFKLCNCSIPCQLKNPIWCPSERTSHLNKVIYLRNLSMSFVVE
jgi:hypothetical protein